MSNLSDRIAALYPRQHQREPLTFVPADVFADVRKSPPKALVRAVEHIREARERVESADRAGTLFSPDFAAKMPAKWQEALGIYRRNAVASAPYMAIEAQRLLLDSAILTKAVDALEPVIAAELDLFEKTLATLRTKYGISVRISDDVVRPFEHLAHSVQHTRDLINGAVDAFADTKLVNAATAITSFVNT